MKVGQHELILSLLLMVVASELLPLLPQEDGLYPEIAHQINPSSLLFCQGVCHSNQNSAFRQSKHFFLSPSSPLRYNHSQAKQSLDDRPVLSSWLLIAITLAILTIAFMFVY